MSGPLKPKQTYVSSTCTLLWPNSSQLWSSLSRFCQVLGNIGRAHAQVGRIQYNDFRMYTNFGQFHTKLGRTPSLLAISPILGEIRPNIGRVIATLGGVASEFGRIEPTLGRNDAQPGVCKVNLDRNRLKFGQVGPIAGWWATFMESPQVRRRSGKRPAQLLGIQAECGPNHAKSNRHRPI